MKLLCLVFPFLLVLHVSADPPEWVLEEFRRDHFVKEGHPLLLQPASSTSIQLLDEQNLLDQQGTVCSLENLEPLNIFSDACMFNGVPCQDLPSTTFSTQCLDHQLVVSKNQQGAVTSVTAQDKTSGHSKTFHVVGDSFVFIPEEARDKVKLQKFKYGAKETRLGGRRTQQQGLRHGNNNENRNLQDGCGGVYKVIEVATPFDHTFCQANGNNEAGAISRITDIMARVDRKYQQQGLCKKVKISNIEGSCSWQDDVYLPGIQTGASGCGGYGLLDFVQDYWIANKTGVSRDTVQFFAGYVQ